MLKYIISSLQKVSNYASGNKGIFMETSKNGISSIKEHEGLRLKAYECQGGVRTIGYGHAILRYEDYDVITEETANELLAKDIRIAQSYVKKYTKIYLKQNQFDALVSFTFNLGSGNFSKSTLLKYVNKKMHKEAAKEFHKWVYAGGNRSKGLIKRRKQEAEMYAKC